MQRNWDIFCRVIDNYGDIGVCWRLARQLAREYGLTVRLWVDEPQSLAAMCPALKPEQATQRVENIEIRHWPTVFPNVAAAAVVIEAFACELPQNYVQAMAAAKPAPRWINLEYLTAESWADDCHGLASPHPQYALTKHFFFPGFLAGDRGLLRENYLIPARDHFQVQCPRSEALEISLFCYASAPVGQLIDLLAQSRRPVHCHLPPGQPQAAVSNHLGGVGPWQHGALKITPLPFLPQEAFDQLLWRCDLNFVRGEDSLVRAIWANRPMIWQIYQQEAEAHRVKLDAYLDRHTQSMPEHVATVIRAMFIAWNTGDGLAKAWPAFIELLAEIAEAQNNWGKILVDRNDLAANLVKFCAKGL